jgi:hypothetical protein
LGTFWLKIEQFWPFEEISIFSISSHLEWDEILKKSSPRKLLSQYQPNFAEMILGWPPSKIVSIDPTSNQDGCQAKNRKRGGFRGEDFFLISSPLFSNLHTRSKSAKVQSS